LLAYILLNTLLLLAAAVLAVTEVRAAALAGIGLL
jgi:hypothetical protein